MASGESDVYEAAGLGSTHGEGKGRGNRFSLFCGNDCDQRDMQMAYDVWL